jgi:hypothetical protein
MALKPWMEPSRPHVEGVVIPHQARGAFQALVLGSDDHLRRNQKRLHTATDWPDADSPRRLVLTKEVDGDRLYIARQLRLRWFAGLDRDIRIETPDTVHTYLGHLGDPTVLRLDMSRGDDESFRRIFSDPQQRTQIAEEQRRGEPMAEGVEATVEAAGAALGYVTLKEIMALTGYAQGGEVVDYVPLGSPLPQ